MRDHLLPGRTGLVLALCFGLGMGVSGAALAHGDEDHSGQRGATAGVLSASAPQRLPDGTLFVPKSSQRQLGLRTALAETKTVAVSQEFNGTVVADANASGRVQATQAGRVTPGANGLASLGQRVRKGQVLAVLQPLSSSVERGNQVAMVAEVEAQLALAANRLSRVEQLEGAVPRKEIEAARIEHAALLRRRDAAASTVQSVESLVAPISGVVSATHVVAGQVVDARDVLFEIVDPARLAVEALAYDPAAVNRILAASADAGGAPIALRYVGRGRQFREQAQPLLFHITGGGQDLAIGQTLRVVAQTTATLKGVPVPLSALVRSASGETVVWVHTQAERFEMRRLRHQRLSADTAVVTQGLATGERVVTQGATLLAQLR